MRTTDNSLGNIIRQAMDRQEARRAAPSNTKPSPHPDRPHPHQAPAGDAQAIEAQLRSYLANDSLDEGTKAKVAALLARLQAL
jgi:hypothetical protein